MRLSRVLVVLVGLAASVAIPLAAAPSRGGTASVGVPPPEWSANAGSWPSHNLDLRNTRANLSTLIDAGNVAQLKRRWTFKLPYDGFCAFTSNPVVAGGVVYLEDPDSDVYRAQPGHGEAALAARLPLAHPLGRPERGGLRVRAALRRDRERGRRARPARRQAGVEPPADGQSERGDRHGAAALRRQASDLDHSGKLAVVLPGRGVRHRLRARCADRQRAVALLDRQGWRDALGRSEGERRRRPLVSAGGRFPRAACSSEPPTPRPIR